MTKEMYTRLEQFMDSCMEDSAHDKEHIYRVLYNALEIAKGEGAVDRDVLVAACLLHDVGRKEQFADPSLCHALVGAQKAYDFLLSQGLDVAFCEKVRHCIQTHRFRKAMQPETLEAKILFDADKLDVTGAIGIARSLMYKAEVAEPLYTREPDGRICDGRREDAPASFLREYKFKLEKLYGKFYTETGAALAKKRQSIAAAFYKALLEEVETGYASGRQMLQAWLIQK